MNPLISVLSLLLPSLLHAQSPSPSPTLVYSQTHSISFAEHTTIPLPSHPPSSLSILAEFIADTPDSILREQGPPNILLSISDSPDDSKSIVTNSTAKKLNDSVVEDYECTWTNPCFKQPDRFDRHAFFTRASRAFVHFDKAQPEQSVYITVRNYNRKFCLRGKHVDPELEGRLLVSVAEQRLCAGYLNGSDTDYCYGRGSCSEGKCDCKDTFGGRVCEKEVKNVDMLPEVKEPDEGWLAQKTLNERDPGKVSYIVEVAAFNTTILRTKATENVTATVVLHAIVLKGFVPWLEKEPMQVDTTVAMWFKTSDDQGGGPFLDAEPQLPGVYHTERICKQSQEHFFETMQYICKLDEVRLNTVLQIAVTANATGSTDEKPQSVVVNFRFFYCDGDGLPPCTSRAIIPWVALPILIFIMALTGLSIIIVLCLDRRHGFTSPVDRLTEKELDRMYPLRKFCSRERRSGEEREEECQICLCILEPDDIVRNLHCDHIYHSKCLDPWLTRNNASCPTCRADVRLEHLSDKRRLRQLVLFCLWPIAYARRRRGEAVNAAAAERAPSPFEVPEMEADIEAGQSVSVTHDSRNRGAADLQAAELELGQTEISFSSTRAVRITNSEVQSSTTQPDLQLQRMSPDTTRSMDTVVDDASQMPSKQPKTRQQGFDVEASPSPEETKNKTVEGAVNSNLAKADPQQAEHNNTAITQRLER